MFYAGNRLRGLLTTAVFPKAFRAKAILIRIHNDLHFSAVDPDIFTPAVMLPLAGEKLSAGGTSFSGSGLFHHRLLIT
jgi:hypothetical protein